MSSNFPFSNSYDTSDDKINYSHSQPDQGYYQFSNVPQLNALQGYPSAIKASPSQAKAQSTASANSQQPPKRKVLRQAGGETWEDLSLGEWDENDYRIFCGDLGNEVTDDVLHRAFMKYKSFTKAKVIRDKYSNKSRGYGFVSFKNVEDFIAAMREMNGKYVGNRPIKLRKSTWKDRNIEVKSNKQAKNLLHPRKK